MKGVLCKMLVGILFACMCLPVCAKPVLLTDKDMESITAGCAPSEKICGFTRTGCGSACINIAGEGYTSYMAIDHPYKECTPKYWWDITHPNCLDNLIVWCAKWKYYSEDNCSGIVSNISGAYLTTAACEGDPVPNP